MELMPEIEGIPEDDLLNCSITKQEDVATVSGRASDFCAGTGIEERTGMMIALAIEEMKNNIITVAD